MELEVGMYVRTIYGIKKIDSISCGEDIRFDNINGFDEDELKTLNYDGIKYQDYMWKEIVIGNPSNSIIDLIEEGDYINDIKVKRILNRDNNYLYIYPLGLDEIMLELTNTDIKSIVTKEQFESMAYKVEK